MIPCILWTYLGSLEIQEQPMICVQKSGYPEAMHGNHNPHSFKFDFFTSRSLSTLYFCALQFVLDHVSCSIHDHVLYMYALGDLVYWVLKYTTDV